MVLLSPRLFILMSACYFALFSESEHVSVHFVLGNCAAEFCVILSKDIAICFISNVVCTSRGWASCRGAWRWPPYWCAMLRQGYEQHPYWLACLSPTICCNMTVRTRTAFRLTLMTVCSITARIRTAFSSLCVLHKGFFTWEKVSWRCPCYTQTVWTRYATALFVPLPLSFARNADLSLFLHWICFVCFLHYMYVHFCWFACWRTCACSLPQHLLGQWPWCTRAWTSRGLFWESITTCFFCCQRRCSLVCS